MNIYQNPAKSTEVCVDDLLSRMELDEKISQMHAVWLLLAKNGGHEVRSDRFIGKSLHMRNARPCVHGRGWRL